MAALGLVSACGSDDLVLGPGGGECRFDSDCPADRACTLGVCAREDLEGWVLDLEVRPPPSSDFVALQRSEVFLSPDRPVEIVLPAPVLHDTVVLGPEGEPVDADLSFRPSSAADRPLDLLHRVRQERPALIPLPPGTYDVRIAPKRADWPSVEIEGFSVQPGVGPRFKEFVLPTRYRRMSGVVRSRVLASLRVGGATIRAVGMETGLASTTGVGDREGAYAIALPESSDTTFLVTASLPEALQPAWEFAQVVRVPVGEDREKVIEVDLPSAVAQGWVALEIVGVGPQGPEPVPGARVTLTASTALGVEARTYIVSAVTDVDGLAMNAQRPRLPVLRGSYAATVEPPAGSIFARRVVELDLDGAGSGVTVAVQIALEPRTPVLGAVVDAEGRPAAYARVGFEAVGHTARTPEAWTDLAGAFATSLDPGTYLMRVDPREGATVGSAARTSRLIRVGSGEPLALEPVVLPRGIPLPGRVVSELGVPVANVEVSLFARTAGVRHLVERRVSGPAGELLLAVPE